MTDEAGLRARIEARVAARRGRPDSPDGDGPPSDPPTADDAADGADVAQAAGPDEPADPAPASGPRALAPSRPWQRQGATTARRVPLEGLEPAPPADGSLAPARPWRTRGTTPAPATAPESGGGPTRNGSGADDGDPSTDDGPRDLTPVRRWAARPAPAEDAEPSRRIRPSNPDAVLRPIAEEAGSWPVAPVNGSTEADPEPVDEPAVAPDPIPDPTPDDVPAAVASHDEEPAVASGDAAADAAGDGDEPAQPADADAASEPDTAPPWRRDEDVDLDLKGAATWNPSDYPPEPDGSGLGRRGRRAARWLFAKRTTPDEPTPAPDDASPDTGGTAPTAAAPVVEPVVPAEPPASYEPEPVDEPLAPEPEPEPEPEPVAVEPEPDSVAVEPEPEPEPVAVEPEPEPEPEPVVPARPRPRPRPAAPSVVAPVAPTPTVDPVPDAAVPAAVPAAEPVAPAPGRARPRPRPRPATTSAEDRPEDPATGSADASVAPVAGTPTDGANGNPPAVTGVADTAGAPAPEAYRSATNRSRTHDPDLSRFLAASEPQAGDDEPERRSRRDARGRAGTVTLDEPARAPEPAAAPAGPKRPSPAMAFVRRWRRLVITVVVVFGLGLGAALLLRQYVVAPYYIPSASMEPTLHGCPGCNDDHILVDKITYRLHDPRQSDIVVFHRPPGAQVEEDVLIKRVIAVGGDKVSLRNGLVYVNNARLEEPYLNTDCGARSTRQTGSKATWTVPKGDLFVMGDNRCDSTDSRIFGPITVSSVVGRAWLIIWPFRRIGTVG